MSVNEIQSTNNIISHFLHCCDYVRESAVEVSEYLNEMTAKRSIGHLLMAVVKLSIQFNISRSFVIEKVYEVYKETSNET